MPQVEIYGWNPKRPLRMGAGRRELRFRGSHRIPRRRVGNFGDLIAPVLVEAMLRELGIDRSAAVRDVRLISIGSIHMVFAPGDVVWGSGVNGHFLDVLPTTDLDVRAVRGPRSRAFLLEHGVERVPEVYGDPAALLPRYRPDLFHSGPRSGALFVPHFHESSGMFVERSDPGPLPSGVRVQEPTRPLRECLQAISSSSFVCASSLHAIVIAEACGIPARVVEPVHEPRFKYDDWFEGTGRRYEPAGSIAEALAIGGQDPPDFDQQALVEAFPVDLWAA